MGRRHGRAGGFSVKNDEDPASMTLVEHLDELRYRLLLVIVPWVLACVGGFFVAGPLLTIIRGPVPRLVVLAPSEAFFIHLRLAFYIGTAVASPLLLYQVVAFVQPALSRLERRQLLLSLPLAFTLLLLGVAFGYWVVLPFILKFFLSFTGPALEPLISVSSYVSFVVGTVVPFGVVFQVPVVVWVLARLGVIDHHLLRRSRRWAILAIFFTAAALTPPDVVSQVLMAIPLLALYELSILLAQVGARQRATKAIVDDANTDAVNAGDDDM